MSLIGDALREAGRAQQSAHRVTTPVGSIMVVPHRRPARRRRRRILALVGVCLAVLAGALIGGLVLLRARAGFAAGPASQQPGSETATATFDTSTKLTVALLAEPASSAPVAAQPAPTSAVAPSAPVARVDTESVLLVPVSSPHPARTPNPASPAPAPRVSNGGHRPAPAGSGQPTTHPTTHPAARPPSAQAASAAAHTPASSEHPAADSRVDAREGPPADSVADWLFTRAYAAHARHDLDLAKRLYEQVLATHAAPAAAYNAYGVLLVQRGDRDAALEMFREAVAHGDSSVDAWVNLGDLLAAAGRPTDALAAFSQANQLAPARMEIRTRLGTQYQAIGDTARARQAFLAATRADPGNPGAHYAFGRFLQSQHELSSALREYQRFVELATGRYPARVVDDVQRYIRALRTSAPESVTVQAVALPPGSP